MSAPPRRRRVTGRSAHRELAASSERPWRPPPRRHPWRRCRCRGDDVGRTSWTASAGCSAPPTGRAVSMRSHEVSHGQRGVARRSREGLGFSMSIVGRPLILHPLAPPCCVPQSTRSRQVDPPWQPKLAPKFDPRATIDADRLRDDPRSTHDRSGINPSTAPGRPHRHQSAPDPNRHHLDSTDSKATLDRPPIPRRTQDRPNIVDRPSIYPTSAPD